jgi:hypothetical protein
VEVRLLLDCELRGEVRDRRLGDADLEYTVADLRADLGGLVGAGKWYGAPGFACRSLEPKGNAARVQAVAAGPVDCQRVPLRRDGDGAGFDAGKVGEHDVFVGEFADVDVWRPRTVAGDSGEWENGLVDDGLGGHPGLASSAGAGIVVHS